MEKSTVIPAKCPKCGSIRRSKKRGSRVSHFDSIQKIAGVECTAIRYSYVTCLDCRQNYIIREPIVESEK